MPEADTTTFQKARAKVRKHGGKAVAGTSLAALLTAGTTALTHYESQQDRVKVTHKDWMQLQDQFVELRERQAKLDGKLEMLANRHANNPTNAVALVAHE